MGVYQAKLIFCTKYATFFSENGFIINITYLNYCPESLKAEILQLFETHSFETDFSVLATLLFEYLKFWVGTPFRPFHIESYRFGNAIINFLYLDIYTYQKSTLNLTALWWYRSTFLA